MLLPPPTAPLVHMRGRAACPRSPGGFSTCRRAALKAGSRRFSRGRHSERQSQSQTMSAFPADEGLGHVLAAFGVGYDALLGHGGEAWAYALDDDRVIRVLRDGGGSDAYSCEPRTPHG